MDDTKSAIVTIAIGKKYIDFYNQYFRPSHDM